LNQGGNVFLQGRRKNGDKKKDRKGLNQPQGLARNNRTFPRGEVSKRMGRRGGWNRWGGKKLLPRWVEEPVKRRGVAYKGGDRGTFKNVREEEKQRRGLLPEKLK